MQIIQVGQKTYILGCDGCQYYDKFARKCSLYGYAITKDLKVRKFCPRRNNLTRTEFYKAVHEVRRIVGDSIGKV